MTQILQTIRLIFALILVFSYFGIAILDTALGGRGWRVVALGIIYGIANAIIFLFK